MSAIGRRIRARRDELGYTQATLAEKAGLGRSSIAQYERGRTRPRAKELESLAQAMSMTVDELLMGRRTADRGESFTLEPEQEILGILLNHPLFGNSKVRKTMHEFLMALEKSLSDAQAMDPYVGSLQMHEPSATFNVDHSLLRRHEETLKAYGKLTFSSKDSLLRPSALLQLKIAPKGTPFKSGQVLLVEEPSGKETFGPDEWLLVLLRGRVHFAKMNPKEGILGFVNPEGLPLSNKSVVIGRLLEAYVGR